MPDETMPLSAVILCHNEAVNLDRCIRALRGCHEILVLDDGSADGSPKLAQALGARVATHRFTSFADQRNWAMEHAGLQNEWVLHLDADEVMTPAALQEIAGLLPSLNVGNVGFLPRKMMLDGRWLRFSADYPVHVARVVHKRGPRFVMRGHGEVIDSRSENGVYLREPMLHYAWSKGWDDWHRRHQRYAEAEARRLLLEGAELCLPDLLCRDPSRRRRALRTLSFKLPCRAVQRFVYAYLLRGGFLDGVAGLRFCLAMARYERMINRCLRRLKQGGGSSVDVPPANEDERS
jgi:glycosyltransferase involved in cell wall biosynthesis